MMKELEEAVLAVDLPEHGLRLGDIGTIVLVHPTGGYEVEFMTLEGETIAVVTLDQDQVRPVKSGEVPHARKLETAA